MEEEEEEEKEGEEEEEEEDKAVVPSFINKGKASSISSVSVRSNLYKVRDDKEGKCEIKNGTCNELKLLQSKIVKMLACL